MTNFSNSDSVAVGTVGLTVRYELYGEVEGALARNGANIETVVHRAFAEVLDLGSSLGILYHYFEINFEKETLHFTLSFNSYRPGEDLVIAISFVKSCPFEVNISDLPEGIRELLGPLTDTDAAE